MLIKNALINILFLFILLGEDLIHMKKTIFFLKIITGLLFGILFIFAILLSIASLTPKIDIKNANNISIYDGNGILFFRGTGSISKIPLHNISKNMIQATIATEDKNYYKHKGFDYPRILKSLFVNVKSLDIVQGASTITQQYARNLYLEFEKNWKRKLEEAWLSFEIELHYSKDEILEGYLNTINYGNGILGIQNASHYYFNKSATDLTLAEASMLAGIPKSPNHYSPLNNEKKAKERQKIILNRMVKNQFIKEEEAKEAYLEKLTYFGNKENLNLKTLMYYQDAVLRELKELHQLPQSVIKKNGLKIYTNLDIQAQTILENSISSTLVSNPSIQNTSIVIKPSTGQIIALAGGRDYSKSEYNRATNAKRQVGSTMKPFLYYAALKNGFTASSTFISEPTTFHFKNTTYSPKNYGNIYPSKPITMLAALSFSDNIYAVKTHLFLGEEMLVTMMKQVHISAKMDEHPSLPLGTKEINIIDFMTGYNVLANEGEYVDLYFIQKIEDENGNIIYSHVPKKEQVLDKNYTFILNDMLSSSYDRSMIDYTYPTCISISTNITKKYAIKSGSTNYDSWTIGYNKDLLVAVWDGYDTAEQLKKGDSLYSKRIWVQTIEGILSNKNTEWYQIPNNVVGVLIDPINGGIATNSTKKRIVYYVKGTEPFFNKEE